MQLRIKASLLRYRWPTLSAGVLAAVLVYALLNTLALTRWEAIGVIRVGKTIGANWLDTEGSGKTVGTNTMPEVLLMPVPLTIELIRHPSFKDKVLEKVKRDSASQGAGVAEESYRVRELMSGNIEIRARATSRERAQEFINQAVAELKSSHDEIYRERISRIKLEIERVEKRQREIIRSKPAQERRSPLAISKADSERLSEKGSERDVSAHLLEAYRHVLDERLDRSLTYPTDLFTPVTVPIAPVEPNWIMHGIYSLLSGVLVALAVLREGLQNRRSWPADVRQYWHEADEP